MRKSKFILLVSLFVLASLLLVQCAPATPEKVVEQVVQTQIIEKEKVVTATPAPKGPVKLTMMVQGLDEQEAFASIGKEFTKLHPDVTVEVQNVPAENWGNYFDKIAVMIAGGQTIDLVRVVSEGAQLVGSLGIARPLDDLLEKDKEFRDEFYADVAPSLLAPFQWEGKQYGLPFEWNTCAIFYNKDLFDKYGVAYPKPDWTIDQFLETAKKMTIDENGDGVTDIWGYQDSYFLFCTEPWTFNAGGSLLNKDWTDSNISDPKTIESLKFMRDLIWEHKVSPTGAEVGFAGQKQMFIAGKIAMIATGRWNTPTFVGAGFTNWDVVPFPKWREQVNIVGVGSTYLLKNSPNPEVAYEFLKFMVNKENISRVAKEGWSIPARRSVGYDESIMGLYPPKNYRFWYDIATTGRPVTAPPQYNKYDEIYSRYLDLIVHNQMDFNEAVKKMDEELKALFAESK